MPQRQREINSSKLEKPHRWPERERVSHSSSHTGRMQVMPGHPLADPRSRLNRILYQAIMETNKGIDKNTAMKTWAARQSSRFMAAAPAGATHPQSLPQVLTGTPPPSCLSLPPPRQPDATTPPRPVVAPPHSSRFYQSEWLPVLGEYCRYFDLVCAHVFIAVFPSLRGVLIGFYVLLGIIAALWSSGICQVMSWHHLNQPWHHLNQSRPRIPH